jgi:hypothetical protein
VIVHGRYSGFGAPVNWIAADIVRIQRIIEYRITGLITNVGNHNRVVDGKRAAAATTRSGAADASDLRPLAARDASLSGRAADPPASPPQTGSVASGPFPVLCR